MRLRARGGRDRSLVADLIQRLGVLPSGRVAVLAVSLLVAIIGADYLTGMEVSLALAYQVPVFLAATASRRQGVAVAALSAAGWTTAQIALRDHPYASAVVPVWNFVARFLILLLVAVLVSALATKLAEERDVSRRDFITGLPNARAFHETARYELDRMRRSGSLLTVAFLDMDGFKAVNDTRGHAAGDELLAVVGGILRDGLGAGGSLARLGGDEFAILLPGVDVAGARAHLRTLHAGLHAAIDGDIPAVGFSVGAVTFADPPESGFELLDLADRLMYMVKQQGKDLVWVETADAVRDVAAAR
jgi:diguanylate cyclase (GGDEF)-like protein